MEHQERDVDAVARTGLAFNQRETEIMNDSSVNDKIKPRRLTSRNDRQMARHMRDGQWEFMARVVELGTVWVCWWNKNRSHNDTKPLPPDLKVCGLIDGMELLEWLNSHKDWWVIGEWSDERYAAPVSLTDAGRAAFAERHRYDMELVTGGLVEPGWCAMPLPLLGSESRQ
jgi:hypothetical protein